MTKRARRTRRSRTLLTGTLPFAAALSCASALLLPVRTSAQEPTPVQVVNLPDVQEVAGEVRIEDPVPHSAFRRIVDITVPPGTLERSIDLVEASEIDVSGFTEVSLSLMVVTGDLLSREGTVRALLVPAEERVAQVLDQYGEAMFPLEVEAVVTPGEGLRHFDSDPVRRPLAFPRYRVLFHNGSAKAVTVSLFAYLTN